MKPWKIWYRQTDESEEWNVGIAELHAKDDGHTCVRWVKGDLTVARKFRYYTLLEYRVHIQGLMVSEKDPSPDTGCILLYLRI